MSKFAATTKVPAMQTRNEIESTLRRYGATGFAFGEQIGRVAIQFEIARRRVRFILPFQPIREFDKKPTGESVAPVTAKLKHEQHIRQRWRALLLAIKSKLEAVESGISSYDDEFLAFLVLPGDGRTVGEWLAPQIEQSYKTNKLPPMLPGLGEGTAQ